MNDSRFLFYIPNHGLGVEMYVMHDVIELARLLDRVIVVPLAPIFETFEYQGGLDEYMEMPLDVAWISTAEYRERYGFIVDEVFQIIPEWRPTYQSKANRDLHPVWLENLHKCSYFECIGLSVGRMHKHVLTQPLTRDQAAQLFATDARSIGISYVNGLIAEVVPQPAPGHAFHGREQIPRGPRSEIIASTRWELGAVPDVALHIRRGNMKDVLATSGRRLPDPQRFVNQIPDNAGLVYVATDSDEVYDWVRTRVPGAQRLRSGHFTMDAVRDLSSCILADRFIGTHYSTYSEYIVHSRLQFGKELESMTMLR